MEMATPDPLTGERASGAAALDPDLPGPFAVGSWADGFRDFLRERPRVLLIGEVFNLRAPAPTPTSSCATPRAPRPAAIWNSDLDRLALPEGALRDGAEVVVGGGPDYYPGTADRLAVLQLPRDLPAARRRGRPARPARPLAPHARRRRAARAARRALPRPAIPRTIGVVTARVERRLRRPARRARAPRLARDDRLGRRPGPGPPRGRRRSRRALRDLAAIEPVEVAVVCRGGGSLTDLWAFCDENLCRTVALLRLPVISAVGHEVDRTLIDDVAAVSCSTPTHAAEALVQRRRRHRAGPSCARRRPPRPARRGLGGRPPRPAARRAARGPRPGRLRAERGRLHQLLREMRASAARGHAERARRSPRTHALVVKRKGDAFAARAHAAARKRLDALAAALGAHDPERTLARGYALVADADGEPVTSAAAARERGRGRRPLRRRCCAGATIESDGSSDESHA